MYVAGEYHAIFVDDATLFADHEYRRLFQVWRRRQGSTTPMRVRVATSPGGPGHDWVRERFAIDNPASVLPLGRRVITATMDDNPYLDREEYRRSLANLDPVRRAQLETGDWSIRQGGAIFQRQWFRIVDRAPAGLRRVRFWDLAATAEPTRTDLLYDPDYTVGALLGQAHDGAVYVLDVIRRRLDPHDVKRHVTPPGGQAASLAVAKDLDSYLELLRVLSESLDERKLRFDLAGGVKNLQAWNRRPELGGRLPYVVLVVDELAELSVEEAADVEEKRRRQEALALLSRMARLGRALGFHIVAATQRPAVDTVPGPIKSQLLARCCFKVASGTESRVVLGEDNSAGAELPTHKGRGIWQWSEPVVFQGRC